MIRVLYVEHIAGIGGGQTFLLDLVRNLDRSRFDPVATLVAGGELRDRLAAAGVTIEMLDIRAMRRRHPAAGLGVVRRLVGILRKHRIGLIHVNSQKALCFALPAGLVARTPVVWHCHVESDFGRIYDLAGSLLCRAIVVNSRHVARRFDGMPWTRRKTRLVYYGIDTQKYRPLDGARVRRELGIEPSAFVIGTLGRVQREKGTRFAVEAAGRVFAEIPEARLLVVGGALDDADPYGREVRELAVRLGVAGRAVFTGFRSDVADCIAAMDVAVVPSLREAFGLAVAEAMAAGKPVVASRVGGIPEIIDDGRTGVLVPAGDAGAIARAVVSLYRDRSAAREMGVAARSAVKSRFGLARHVEEIQAMYEELARG